MSYNFNLENIDEFFYSTKDKQNKVRFPNNLGYLINEKEVISQDISVFKENLFSSCDISMATQSQANCFLINIGLQGDILGYDQSTKEHRNYYNKNTNIDYLNEVKGVVSIKKNTNSKRVGIVIKGDFLQKHFFSHLEDKQRALIEENYKQNIPINLKNKLSSQKVLFLANEIYNSPFSGELESIYLQSKVYEIIYNEFSSLIQNKKTKNISKKTKYSKEDIQALHKAKDILIANKQYLTISQLAKKVALNEYKLKHGFKYLFNTTPGSIILESKMYEAKELLKTSELNVSEIANKVGYKYVQNFTYAFKKFFKESPSDILKSRKHYY